MNILTKKIFKQVTVPTATHAVTLATTQASAEAVVMTATRAKHDSAHGWLKMLWLSAALAFGAGSAIADQGVSSNEILIGTIQDLSGPLAGYGKAVRNGMQMRMDEINEQGGVNGRKLRLVTEDSGYDPKRAVLAAQKLVNQDKIFMMLAHIGTAQNNAAMPVLFDKNIVNFMPVTAAREMYEPLNRLKYANFATYYDQMRSALPILIKEKKLTKVCVIHQDDEFGLEVLRGAESALKTMNMEFAEKTSFKRGATDFSSQVARMKSAGCEMVVLGTIIRETVGTIAEARKNGFNPLFIGSSAAYTDLIHKLGGKATEGMYATMTVPHPYLDEASKPIATWANKYKTRFTDDPTVFSVYGYILLWMPSSAVRRKRVPI